MDVELFHKAMFESIYEQFEENRLCDVKILTRENPESSRLKPILCHSLVLASVAPNFKKILIDPDLEKEVEDQKCVLMPDMDYADVKKFIDDIYVGLKSKEIELELSTDLAEAFAIMTQSTATEITQMETSLVDDVEIIDDVTLNSFDLSQFDESFGDSTLPSIISFDQAQLKDILDKEGESVSPDASQLSTSPASVTPGTPSLKRPLTATPSKLSAKKKKWLLEPWSVFKQSLDLPPMKTKKKDLLQSAAASTTNKPPVVVPKPPVVEPKPFTVTLPPPQPLRIVYGPFRYNPVISQQKSTYWKVKNLETGFQRNFGLFRATTDCFYTTPKVVDDKTIKIMIGDQARQFRMKLPEKAFVAVVAVGLRNGENIVHNLAMKKANFQPQTSFVNLISMAKNICGVSFGDILRHPRCSEIHRDKISRETIDRFKFEFQKLTVTERTKMGQTHLKFLRDFDSTEDKIELLHLPQKPIRMEFRLASEIGREEILDYAIVSGDTPRTLTIQSLFNLSVQKFPTNRLLTIICDLISCFLDYDNKTPLTEYPYLKECFEKYANRTCKLQALRELGMEQFDESAILEARRPTDSPKTPAGRKTRGGRPTTKPKKDEPPKKYACTEEGCTKSFAEEFHRQIHITRMHVNTPNPKPEKPPEEPVEGTEKTCPPCSKVFRDTKELKMHLYYFHTPKECKACNLTFPGTYHLYKHQTVKHPVTVTCDVCGKTGIKKAKLAAHKINYHLPDHERPFICSFCGKGFAHRTKKDSHEMSVHIRTRPWKCRLEGCTADFNEMANRNAHERTVHKYNYKEIMSALNDTT